MSSTIPFIIPKRCTIGGVALDTWYNSVCTKFASQTSKLTKTFFLRCSLLQMRSWCNPPLLEAMSEWGIRLAMLGLFRQTCSWRPSSGPRPQHTKIWGALCDGLFLLFLTFFRPNSSTLLRSKRLAITYFILLIQKKTVRCDVTCSREGEFGVLPFAIAGSCTL